MNPFFAIFKLPMALRIYHEIIIKVIGDAESDILKLLKELKILNTNTMAKIDDLKAKITAQGDVIVEIKKDLDFIKAKLAEGEEGGLTAAQVIELEAAIDETSAKLSALDAETDSSETPPVEPA